MSLEEVVVTATRREESLSRVPISVTAFNQDRLDDQGVKDVEDIARLTPNLNFSRGSYFFGSNTDISIRGIDSGVGAHTTGIYIETYDGYLSDIEGLAVTRDMAFEALESAASGAIEEGNVGGGVGMICHEFKGGTGSASRVVSAGYTVGALVQANYGRRDLLRIDGVPVGREFGIDRYPSPWHRAADAGSIIVILATDAPLLPIQCQRLARRATTGLAWVGGIGANSSGDIFLAFSTANHVREDLPAHDVRMLAPDGMTALFQAAAEATEEAILNALSMAETITGLGGRTAHALPLDAVVKAVKGARAPYFEAAASVK